MAAGSPVKELPLAFSAAELARRRGVLDRLAGEAGVDAVLIYGANRSGGAVPWLTGWPVTAEAHLLVLPGERPRLWVAYVNHLPNARRVATDVEVLAGGSRRALPELRAALAGVRRLGVIGALPWTQVAGLGPVELVDLSPAYTRARLVKSGEELAALREAAALTDGAMLALRGDGLVGASEHELQARIQASYLAAGGLHHVSYLTVTSPDSPDRCVPAQWPSARRVGPGDMVSCELSTAAAPEMAAQLLRTFVAARTVPPVVGELHAVAEACFEAVAALLRPGTSAAELVAATGLVEDAGFTTVDDVVHGYGGGYLPPVLNTRSREPANAPSELVLEAGMVLVVQPNVVTPDLRLGVQTGELLEVTESGPARLHAFPPGLQLVPPD